MKLIQARTFLYLMVFILQTTLIQAETRKPSSSTNSVSSSSSSKINLSDGVDKNEAQQLAWEYFLKNFGGCGSPGDVSEETESEWKFTALAGIGAEHVGDIYVNKKTGAVRLKKTEKVQAEKTGKTK